MRKLQGKGVGEILVSDATLRSCEEFDLHSMEEVIDKADIVVLLVNHSQYSDLTANMLKEKIVIDTRGVVR